MNFHHTCILTGKRELAAQCERFYLENFGMGITFASIDADSDYSFYTDNTHAECSPFEIIGRAFDEREHAFLNKNGPGLDHLCFQVEDIQKAYKNMRDGGIEFHVPPYRYEDFLLAWCHDPCGVEVELLQADIKFPPADYSHTAPSSRYHHIAIIAGNLELARKTTVFYQRHIGLRKVANTPPPGKGKSVYLQDESSQENAWIEIIGKASNKYEQEFIQKKGPGLQHHCFVVDNVDAYADVLELRRFESKPEHFDIKVSRMFYVKDPVDVCVQVLEMDL